MTLSPFCPGHAGHCAGLRRGPNLIILADRGRWKKASLLWSGQVPRGRMINSNNWSYFSLASRPRRRPGLDGLSPGRPGSAVVSKPAVTVQERAQGCSIARRHGVCQIDSVRSEKSRSSRGLCKAPPPKLVGIMKSAAACHPITPSALWSSRPLRILLSALWLPWLNARLFCRGRTNTVGGWEMSRQTVRYPIGGGNRSKMDEL